MAVIEFSSSNGLSSFNLFYECRDIQITEIEDENQSHFSYLTKTNDQFYSEACEARGYKEWAGYYDCITTFQGSKCSMNHGP